jgi:hypothetical protein
MEDSVEAFDRRQIPGEKPSGDGLNTCCQQFGRTIFLLHEALSSHRHATL